MYASFLGISGASDLDVFEQPVSSDLFSDLLDAFSLDATLDKSHDVLSVRSGAKDLSDSTGFERRDIFIWNDAASDDQNVLNASILQQFHDLWEKVIVGSGEDAHGDDVYIFLNSSFDNLARRLPQSGVDDLHPSIHEGTGHDLDASVMTVQTGLGG
jgi:hypothetical protein